MVRQQKKNKTNSAQKDNTPTNHPNSGETGHFSEPENKRQSMTTSPKTPVLTAGVAALTSGEVVSVLTGAAPPDLLKNSPQFVMAGNQDALQLNGTTSVYVIGEEEGGGGGDRPTDVPHAAGPLCTRTERNGRPRSSPNMARMIHSHDETVDQTKVLPKMEHIRGEKNLPYKKAEQQRGGDFVTNQDHGEAFPSKLAATGYCRTSFQTPNT